MTRELASSGAPIKGAHRARPPRVGEPLGHPVPIRLSPAMRAAARKDADSIGLTLGAWVRAVLAERLEMTEPADLQPVRAYGGGGPDVAAMNALRMQLHELGGLLTQVAKVSRLSGDSSLHASAEATLADVREAIGLVAQWQKERRGA